MQNPKISLIIGVISISIFPVLVKWAPVSGITSAFYRMFIGFICLLPYVIIAQKFEMPRRALWPKILLCGILFGTDIAVWNLSIHYSNATQATLLTNLSPVWVGIGSLLFLAIEPGRRFWLGTCIALSGLVVLLGVDTLAAMQFDKGFILALISGMLYATYMIVSKTVLNHVKIVPFIILSMGVSSIYLLGICLVFDQPLWGFSASVWSVLAVQGIVCQLLGWLTLSYAVQKMDAQSVSLSLLSQGIITALMAWAFIDEQISWNMILGGIIILAGIGVTFRKPVAGQSSGN
jgi:drug/metabolite transporter (DMT)-like permease